MSATDIDSENNGAVTYYIDPADTVANTYFMIDAATGLISSNAQIDYETYPTLSFDVYATDGPGLVSTTQVDMTIMDENDNPPTFSPVTLYNFEVPTDAEPGYYIGQVAATDPDTGTIQKRFIKLTQTNYHKHSLYIYMCYMHNIIMESIKLWSWWRMWSINLHRIKMLACIFYQTDILTFMCTVLIIIFK